MSGTQIEVRRKKSPYTNIQNKLIWDENLRPQTKWVLIAMLSLPDDWDYSIRGLSAKTGLAKETISKMLSELERAGYLRRKPQSHGEGGRFAGTEYILTDVAGDFSEAPDGSEGAPCPILPCTVEPCTVNSPQQNKDKQTKEQIPPYSPPTGDGESKDLSTEEMGEKELSQAKYKPEWFNRFYDRYPLHKGRAAAIKAWDKLKPSYDLCVRMAAALERDMRSEQWQKDKQYIPHPSSWLNGRRWEDEEEPPSPVEESSWAPDRGRYE